MSNNNGGTVTGPSFCVGCGAQVGPGARFCTKCGRTLGGGPTAPCGACGKPCALGARYCSRCGKPLRERMPGLRVTLVKPVSRAAVRPVSLRKPEVPKMPVKRDWEAPFCTRCGKRGIPGKRFCVRCGLRLR